MRRIITIAFVIICFGAFAQIPTGHFHYSPFQDQDGNSYIETYLAIAGNSVTYKPTKDDKEQASVEITILFKNGDIVKAYRKYNLKSPESDIEDTLKPNFIDLQRISIPNGSYNFELKLKDNYADTTAFEYKDIITIELDSSELAFSGFQFAENITPSVKQNIYTKSGYDIIPYVTNFYPESVNKLSFYMEIYNTNKALSPDSMYIINTYIEGHPTRRKYTEFTSFEKKNAGPVNVIVKEFDISKLNSGNYNLVVEVRNRNNEIIGEKKAFFQRLNNEYYELDSDYSNIDVSKTFAEQFTNYQKLSDIIYALYPISEGTEKKFILQEFEENELRLMQQFFYNFWKERNPHNPEQEWEIYKKQLQRVQQAFGYGKRRGYATDLGRIYLKYGPPSSIKEERLGQNTSVSVEGEDYVQVDAVEYQIWHYYKVNNQFDRIFIFIKGLNEFSLGSEYVLMYTDVQGELSYDDGLNFTSIPNLINSIDSKMLQDIQNESARALSRFLSGREK